VVQTIHEGRGGSCVSSARDSGVGDGDSGDNVTQFSGHFPVAKLLKSSFSGLIRPLKHGGAAASFGVNVEPPVKPVTEKFVIGGKVHNSGPWVVSAVTKVDVKR
jgi:hypothetical protein